MGSNSYSLFMGFTFTAIVVFLTLLPDPTQPRLQVILFSLSSMFHILGYLLFIEEAVLPFCMRFAQDFLKVTREELSLIFPI